MKTQIENIYLGYWYQRTTLHLSEIYDFLKNAKSPLDLERKKLEKFQTDLQVKNLEMKIGYFEYLEFQSRENILARVYEDGLTTFEIKPSDNLRQDLKELNSYFEKYFSPAISYLFSLGAPVPKELANIQSISPYFLVVRNPSPEGVKSIFQSLRERKYYEIKGEGVEIYRGENIFLVCPQKKFLNDRDLVEMQIFFREFKVQLHRYLNIHRIIWEKIADIKEQGKIRGKDIEELRNKLESYKKTIEIIEGRIEQMGTHIKTRKNIINNLGWGGFLSDILEFKYDTLDNSLNYIKALWKMTKNYVDSAIRVLSEVQSESTKDSVKTLTLVTSIGVISGILGYLSVNKLPQFTKTGILFFIILLAGTYLANKIIVFFFKNCKYKLKSVDVDKKID